MKRTVQLLIVVFVQCLVGLSYGDSGRSFPDPGEDPMQIVMADIARQVVMSMPGDSSVAIVGQGAITDDDGRLRDAIRSATVSATDYKVIDFAQLSHPVSETTARTTDMWLLTGNYIKVYESVFGSYLSVFFEMKSAKNGEYAFSKNFSARYIAPIGWGVVISGLSVLTLVALFLLQRSRRRILMNDAVKAHAEAQLAIGNEVKKTRDNIKRIQDVFITRGEADHAVRMRDQQNELDRLLQDLEQWPGMHTETGRREMKQLKKNQKQQNKLMMWLVRNLQVESEKLLKSAERQNASATESALAELTNEIKNCRNRMYNAMTGRA